MGESQQFLGRVRNFQSALPFVGCASCRTQVRLRDRKVHVLKHWLDWETFADQQVLDLIPALERGERVQVLQKKVLRCDARA